MWRLGFGLLKWSGVLFPKSLSATAVIRTGRVLSPLSPDEAIHLNGSLEITFLSVRNDTIHEFSPHWSFHRSSWKTMLGKDSGPDILVTASADLRYRVPIPLSAGKTTTVAVPISGHFRTGYVKISVRSDHGWETLRIPFMIE